MYQSAAVGQRDPVMQCHVKAAPLVCLTRRIKEPFVPAHTYKIIDLVGSSESGTDDAISNAISKASLSVKNMDWFEVVETRGHIIAGKIAHYQVTIRVGFRIEE